MEEWEIDSGLIRRQACTRMKQDSKRIRFAKRGAKRCYGGRPFLDHRLIKRMCFILLSGFVLVVQPEIRLTLVPFTLTT